MPPTSRRRRPSHGAGRRAEVMRFRPPLLYVLPKKVWSPLNMRLKSLAAIAALFVVSACNSNGGSSAVPAAPGGPGTQSTSRGPAPMLPALVLAQNVREVCPHNTAPGFAHCDSLVRTDVMPDAPRGYGPADLQAAYALPSKTNGKGQTIALVDAFDDPNAEADLAVYRSTFGLAPCTTKNRCFAKVNQRGQQGHYPGPDPGWAAEISIDVDMVSAGCPKCKILLVEADDNFFANLGAAVDEAVALKADVVSNSYGGHGDRPGPYNHKGVIILASSGDAGFGPQEPAGFPTVVSVGGTSLVKGGGGRAWTETVWSGTGSGCTTFAKPSWQHDAGCTFRTMNDVAAVADPSTGVSVYDTFQTAGWLVYGGTSVASPLLGAIYGLAGNTEQLNAAQSLYTGSNYLYDITVGQNGSCKRKYLCVAGVGYDGPTGNGTPNGTNAF
jgi:hypothetical protein